MLDNLNLETQTDASKLSPSMAAPSLALSLAAGGIAGTSVDVSLFPIDTIKTRLQTRQGFWAAGGVKGIYRGVGAAALGSAPSGALFFGGYEVCKPLLTSAFGRVLGSQKDPGSKDVTVAEVLAHSASAGVGETIACLVRVPTEVVKQRMQVLKTEAGAGSAASSAAPKTAPTAGTSNVSFGSLVSQIYKQHGLRGFYVGFGTTVAREIPFAFIQFPIYEELKRRWRIAQGAETSPLQGAVCGSAAGTVAAAITTPLDVVKTRLMTQDAPEVLLKKGIKPYDDVMMRTMARIFREEGGRALFAGVGPRVGWIGLGGFVFFGVYEGSKKWLGAYI